MKHERNRAAVVHRTRRRSRQAESTRQREPTIPISESNAGGNMSKWTRSLRLQPDPWNSTPDGGRSGPALPIDSLVMPQAS